MLPPDEDDDAALRKNSRKIVTVLDGLDYKTDLFLKRQLPIKESAVFLYRHQSIYTNIQLK